MESFFTVFAWVMIIPSGFVLVHQLLGLLVVAFDKRATLTMGKWAVVPWIMFGLCLAWILH